jgi:uncharacterized Fe-S center protein
MKTVVFHLEMDRWQDVPLVIRHLTQGDKFIEAGDFVAIKLHFGEKGNTGHVKAEWVHPIVKMCKEMGGMPYLTDTNTIYRGERRDAVSHLFIAHGHGFKIEKTGAPVIIADGIRGKEFEEVEINRKHFKSVKIAKGILDADAMIVLSHAKGHILTGFGGALKNLGMGCSAKGGKYEMHSSISPKVIEAKCIKCGKCIRWCPSEAISLTQEGIKIDEVKCVGCGECIQACPNGALDIPWDVPSRNVQERLVEYAYGAVSQKKGKLCFINYLHTITKYCDCFSSDKNELLLEDLGILVSLDPVAIDKASLDIINKEAGRDIFREMNEKDYTIQLKYAEEIGLGSTEYELRKWA